MRRFSLLSALLGLVVTLIIIALACALQTGGSVDLHAWIAASSRSTALMLVDGCAVVIGAGLCMFGVTLSRMREQAHMLSDDHSKQVASMIDRTAELARLNDEYADQVAALEDEVRGRQTEYDAEIRRLTEQTLYAVQGQVEANTRQMEAVNYALQFHRTELRDLRRGLKDIKKLPEPLLQALLEASQDEPDMAAGTATASRRIESEPSYSDSVAIIDRTVNSASTLILDTIDMRVPIPAEPVPLVSGPVAGRWSSRRRSRDSAPPPAAPAQPDGAPPDMEAPPDFHIPADVASDTSVRESESDVAAATDTAVAADTYPHIAITDHVSFRDAEDIAPLDTPDPPHESSAFTNADEAELAEGIEALEESTAPSVATLHEEESAAIEAPSDVREPDNVDSVALSQEATEEVHTDIEPVQDADELDPLTETIDVELHSDDVEPYSEFGEPDSASSVEAPETSDEINGGTEPVHDSGESVEALEAPGETYGATEPLAVIGEMGDDTASADQALEIEAARDEVTTAAHAAGPGLEDKVPGAVEAEKPPATEDAFSSLLAEAHEALSSIRSRVEAARDGEETETLEHSKGSADDSDSSDSDADIEPPRREKFRLFRRRHIRL